MEKWGLELQFPKWRKIKMLACFNIYYIQCTVAWRAHVKNQLPSIDLKGYKYKHEM